MTVAVKGKGAYSRMKYEAGVHRVQRVPKTESQGRVHTSTATVAVLPEVEEVDVEIDPNDVKVDVYRSTGPGGQSVNTTDSAVRLTHLPTGSWSSPVRTRRASSRTRRRRCASSGPVCISWSWSASTPSWPGPAGRRSGAA